MHWMLCVLIFGGVTFYQQFNYYFMKKILIVTALLIPLLTFASIPSLNCTITASSIVSPTNSGLHIVTVKWTSTGAAGVYFLGDATEKSTSGTDIFTVFPPTTYRLIVFDLSGNVKMCQATASFPFFTGPSR